MGKTHVSFIKISFNFKAMFLISGRNGFRLADKLGFELEKSGLGRAQHLQHVDNRASGQ